MFSRALILFALSLWMAFSTSARVIAASESENAVQRLPDLAAPDAWHLRDGDENSVSIAAVENRLAITSTMKKGEATQLLLREPLPIPADSDLSFVIAAQEFARPLWIFPLVRDANGREYFFHSQSNGSLNPNAGQKGLYLGGRFRGGLEGVSEARFNVPGLTRLDSPSANFEPVKAGDPRPVAPLTLLGIQFQRSDEGPEVDDNRLYVGSFAWTKLNAHNTKLHYQFDDQERFEELDGLPQLPIGDLGKRYGRMFDITWEVRDQYEGQPFLAGANQFQLDPEDKAKPYALQRCQKIEIPIRQEGTYWVRIKLRWADRGTVPEEISEREYRLFVIKGEPRVVRTVLSEVARTGEDLVRFAPARQSLVWDATEKFLVPVAFFAPADAGVKAFYRLRAFSLRGKVMAEVQGELNASQDKAQTINLDLSGFPPGAYRVEAGVLVNGRPIDETRRLVGKRTAATTKAAASIPEAVPSYQQILSGDKSLFHLDPMIGENLISDENSRADIGRKFMDMARGVSTDLEWQVYWRDVEPLPGVYDFSALDQFLDDAKERGFSVLLWAALQDYPEWLPSLYTQNEKGEIFGQSFYLFHGARLNLVQASALREPALRFLRNLVIHSRNHPAVQGYFYLLEHPGDAPYSGWYEGYDPQTLANFRAAAQKKYLSIADANRAWQTSFASFKVVEGPKRDKPGTDKFWLDWMQFRSGSIHQFLLDCARTIRDEDPRRLIMVYADGLVPERLEEFRALGCMTANGGCADPERGVPSYIHVAQQGVPQRAEEVTVGQWSAKSPTQLDASLFAMLMGGGGNSHCKMYVDVATALRSPAKDFEVFRKPPYSLDRYQQFMPIWDELRATTSQPVEIRYFEDFNAYLVQTKTTYAGWDADAWAVGSMMGSHLLFGTMPAQDWQKAKLVVLIRSHLEVLQRQTIDDLVKYVEAGGTIVMRADAGRHCVEEPGSDWALLRRFGFDAPMGERIDDQYTKAKLVPGGILPADERELVLREIWNAGEKQPGQPVALFGGDSKRVAVSERKVGRGSIVVVWASTLVPPAIGSGPEGGYPLLRQVAARAGASLPVHADTSGLWLNLLTHRSGETHYGLVYCSRQAGDKQSRRGQVRFQIPEGTYEVRELISGKDLGQISAVALSQQGLEVTLVPDAVAIYRFGPKPK